MKTCSPHRRLRRLFIVIGANAGLFAAAFAQAPLPLDPYITTATRTPTAPQNVGSAVDVISNADLARRQISSLADALGTVPGAPLFQSGQMGASTSLFLRGANSNQTLFLVDGLRLNDPNTDYLVFLGGACVGACDSLEVAHGPQSTLYGGEAVGGVISLRAQRGSGPLSGRVSVEAGSFGTIQGAASAQAEVGKTAYSFSAQGGHTENQRANNDFDSSNVVFRLDHTVSEQIAIGGTVRWFHGVYGSPGDRYTNDPDNQDREENLLVTAFTDLKFAPDWTAHATLGGQDRRFVSENPRAGSATQVTVVKNRRAVLDAQTTYSGLALNRITAGFTAEANHTRNTGFGDINKKQGLFAVFAQDEFTPIENVTLTGGLRSDDFDTFGRATTGRATAAWMVLPKFIKLRSSYGTAFRSPSFLDLYGKNAFYVGNPNLQPEKARGWDAGVDFYLPDHHGTVSLTWFDTKFTNLIVSNFAVSPSSVANVQRAKTRGFEFASQLTLPASFELRLNYTYLEAKNLSANIRLLRRPSQSGSVDLWHDFGGGFSLGTGVAVVAQREDVDARTFRTIDGEDYTVARLYAAWQVTPRFAVKARLENALNEKYEEVNGYPALGAAGFASVEWKF